MRRILYFLTLTACWTASSTAQQSLPIKSIYLYKNGMAYVIRSGRISQPLRLAFHPDDMNDLLKTFTAWNPQTGALYSLGYTTGIPTEQLLGRYPFDLRNPNAGLAAFLAQVKGAPVTMEVGGRQIQGKLLAVNPAKKAPEAQTLIDDHQVSVLQETGSVETVWLSDVRSLKMNDPQLQNQLQSYLEILAEGSQDVTREISIYPGDQPGPVLASYLQQFPVWKTSYRLKFEKDRPDIEGWALIDNPTGEAWEGVDLTLISGMPISFVMDLYEPLYSDRTEVPVPGAEAASPRTYQTAVQTRRPASAAPPPPGRAVDEAAPMAEMALPKRRSAASLAVLSAGATAPGYFPEADAAQIQDYFEYRFPFPVQLAGRQSAFLPFLRKPISAERISIFNAQQDETNPLNGVRLHNDSGVPLDAGPVTVLEQGRYAGEALLEYLPRGERRFISYGVDYEVVISRDEGQGTETVTGVKIERGVATLRRQQVQTHRYQLRNKADRAKTVWIEHPRYPGRELKGIQPDETSEDFYRFKVELAAGEEKELDVPEVLSQQTVLRIADADRDQIGVFFSGWTIPRELRQKLDAIADVRRRLSESRSRQSDLEREIAEITRDQDRLRENLKALGTSREEAPLRNRYVDQLSRQEDRLAELREEAARVREEVRSLSAELAEKVAALEWE